MENNIIYFIPSILLVLGGFLFVKFKTIYWNSPLAFFFKNRKEEINIITGKLWILGGIILFFIVGIFKLLKDAKAIVFIYIYNNINMFYNLFNYTQE